MSAGEQQPVEPTEADTQVAEAPAPDALMARLDEMSAQLGRLTAPPASTGGLSEQVAGEPQAQQYEPGAYEPDYGQAYEPGQYDTTQGDPYQEQQQAAAQLQAYIAEQVAQGVQNAVTPWMHRQKAEALEQRYPDLQNPDNAARVVQATQQMAQRMGRPELARDPELVELVYLAERARSNAAQETPADGGQGVALEAAGAAHQAEEEDAGDRMLRAWGIDPAAH